MNDEAGKIYFEFVQSLGGEGSKNWNVNVKSVKENIKPQSIRLYQFADEIAFQVSSVINFLDSYILEGSIDLLGSPTEEKA